MKISMGIGINKFKIAGIRLVVKNFITRVEADGGTVEAVTCLNQAVADLDV